MHSIFLASSYMFFYTVLFTILSAVNLLPLTAQNIPFIPPVYNYTTNNYKAGNQNWSIAQGNNGVIYFGNNNGLMSFDGVNWDLHTLPNNLSVKSIFIHSENEHEQIFVGSFEEFGYFERNKKGRMKYHSLKDKVKDYTFHNDEIWSINFFEGKIYFQSFSKIFVYDNGNITILNPYPAVLYFFQVNDKMYAQLINSNLCRFDGTGFRKILSRDQVNDDDIVAMLPLGDEYLLLTSKSGLYRFSETDGRITPFRTELEEELKEAVINRAIYADPAQFIIGTINKGVYALNYKGEVVWNIDRNNGLNNNTILALFSDKDMSIWAALDNGISNIRTSSPFSIFEPSDVQIGLVEEILFHKNNIYLATNQGVYQYSEPDMSLNPFPGFDVQSWFIKGIGDQVFIGHNLGTSEIKNGSIIPVNEAKTGGMDLKQTTLHGENILIEASYTSMYIYKQNSSGQWKFSHAIKGFSDLIKNIEIDHTGNIWAGHMYKGIYRIRLDKELQEVTEIESIESLDTAYNTPLPHINLMKFRGRIVFTDGNSFYTYDDIKHTIIPFDLLNNDLPDFADTYRIVPVTNDLFWFIRNNEYSLVKFDKNQYVVKDRIPYSILNNPPNLGRANVYVSESEISYFTLNGGIGRHALNEDSLSRVESASLHFSHIRYFNRKSEESDFLNPKEKGVLNFTNNNLDFRFSYPEFSRMNVKVETLLEGYDNRWVETDENHSALYNNLPAGDYILRARIIDNSGNQVSSLNYAFKVENPWYKTTVAIISYILVLLIISGIFSKNHIQKTIRKKSEIFTEQETKRVLQIEQQKIQINRLRTEKLEADLTHKGKELANATMMNINHSEFLKILKEQIQKYTLEGKINRLESNKLLKMIGENLSDDNEWNIFQENFDLIHENFFRKLKNRYPSLTPSDLKLCTLLRLNYSTKDIAKLLNISIRGVESARYRLRKKLNLDESVNLVEFMINFI